MFIKKCIIFIEAETYSQGQFVQSITYLYGNYLNKKFTEANVPDNFIKA